jgi:N-acyl amino acid synthase of PEP-CTERM/exosortase system
MRCDAPRHSCANDPVLGPFCVGFAFGEDGRFEEFRLRYQVFVEERGFEPPSAARLERDQFDAASCALLLRDVATGEVAAAQRLILPDYLPAGVLTNFEREYRRDDDCVAVDVSAIPRNSWAEVSRTAVAPRYRWGARGTTMPAIVAIKYATLALALAFGRSTLFSLSELATAKLIRRLRFPMVRVGAPVEFHGRRAPFRMDVESMVRSVAPEHQQALDRLIEAASDLAARGGRIDDHDPRAA